MGQMLGSPVLGLRNAAAQIPEGAEHLTAAACVRKARGVRCVSRAGVSAKQGCDCSYARVGIKEVPGFSAPSSASRASRFQKDSKELVPIHRKMMRTVGWTEVMSYERSQQELCLAWRSSSEGTGEQLSSI